MEIVKIFYTHTWLIDLTEQRINLGIRYGKLNVEITKNQLNEKEYTIIALDEKVKNTMLAIIMHESIEYYLHIRNSHIYLTPFLNAHSEKSISLNIKLNSDRFELMKTKFSYVVKDTLSEYQFPIDDKIFIDGRKKIDLPLTYVTGEPYVYMRIIYENITTTIEYTLKTKNFAFKTVYASFFNTTDFQLEILSANILLLKNENSQVKIKVNELIREKKLSLPQDFSRNISESIFLKIGKRVYVIAKDEYGESTIHYNLRSELLLYEAVYSFERVSGGLKVKGDIHYKFNINANSIVTNKGVELTKIEWLNDREFIGIIKDEKLEQLIDMHNALKLALDGEVIHSLQYYSEKQPNKKNLETFELHEKVYVVRLSQKNEYILTTLPTLPMYNRVNRMKIRLAQALSSRLKPKNKNINLYYEKDASRALESSIYVFRYVKKDKAVHSINKFVLDKNSAQYSELKKQYGKDILTRFSFKHYLYIFMADNFIASELSNHVLATRIYNEELVNKISSVPFYFLQHGIMFAKPVDNPMAKGFHKQYQVNNLIKSVISSDLEAGEFYKMGYEPEDLMKTGLPKMDGAVLNPNADKIAFMPTWRYWEESYIINNEIEKTSYYKSLIEVIELFKKEGLLERLLIVPHNKFTEYISKNMLEYKALICEDPTEALLISQIFITDYSSIIYDSIYRGTYPIFYWAESDYLIENYKAIPPVNEENAPGAVANSPQELIAYVKEAIRTNYVIPPEMREKYRKINEFSDNQNTKRVVDILKKDEIL